MSEQSQRTWWSRHWKWVVPVGCLAPVLGCGGMLVLILTLFLGAVRSSVPYTESLAEIKGNPQAQQELGSPIEAAFFVTGQIETSGSTGHADLTYPVSGPDGSGSAHVVADKVKGEWILKTLDLEVETTGKRIDVLPQE